MRLKLGSMYKICLFALLAFVPACQSSSNVRVHSYWGTTIERPPLGAVYDWSADSATRDETQDEKIRKAIQEDFDGELQSMGFVKRLADQAPDLIISAHWGRGLQPSPSGPEQKANLAVRVHDARTGRLIYCASADALVDPFLTPEDRRFRLGQAARDLLSPLAPCPRSR